MPSGIVQVCSRCRSQKRKCDRRLPICSLCQRLKQKCIYPAPDTLTYPKEPSPPIQAPNSLSSENIRSTLSIQISAIMGNSHQVLSSAAEFFRTIHSWLPVISHRSFSARLVPARITSETADFCLLTLLMHLLCSKPIDGTLTEQTRSLYLLLKSLVGMMEAVGISTLEMVQARLLMTVFEVGHRLYPATYISSGANLRAAMNLGVHVDENQKLLKIFGSGERAEEAQRTWSGVLVTDRYITLERAEGSGLSMEQFSQKTESGSRREAKAGSTDPLAELTQAAQLLAEALAHIHEPPTGHTPKANETLRIMNNLKSFLIECSSGRAPHDAAFSSAVAMCRSAMLEMLAYEFRRAQTSIGYDFTSAQETLHSLINDLLQAATVTVSNPSLVSVDAIPVFIPHSIHKAAITYLQTVHEPEKGNAEQAIRPLIDLLSLIGTRWLAAGSYANEIERQFIQFT